MTTNRAGSVSDGRQEDLILTCYVPQSCVLGTVQIVW